MATQCCLAHPVPIDVKNVYTCHWAVQNCCQFDSKLDATIELSDRIVRSGNCIEINKSTGPNCQ